MKVRELHPWDLSPNEAIRIQNILTDEVKIGGCLGEIRSVAGMDVGYSRISDRLWAGVVVLSYPDLTITEQTWAEDRARFPYVPGLLSFREIPAILKAIKHMRAEPDLFFCDAQGIAHPRGLGLASHLGILLDRPTIGCAKSRLIGEFRCLSAGKGSHVPLWHKGKILGAVLRTRSDVKPLFVSPGHRVGIRDSVAMTLSCTGSYRMPEPTRQAHHLVNRMRRKFGA